MSSTSSILVTKLIVSNLTITYSNNTEYILQSNLMAIQLRFILLGWFESIVVFSSFCEYSEKKQNFGLHISCTRKMAPITRRAS